MQTPNRFFLTVVKLAIITELLCGTVAHAQLGQNIGIGSAKALSLANAVTADPPGIDAIHYNPAGLAKLEGRVIQIKAIAGDFQIQTRGDYSEEYVQILDQLQLTDPISPDASTVDQVVVKLPVLGLIDVPAPMGVLGGMSFSTYDRRFTFANAAYTPMIAGYKRDENDWARFQGNELAITQLTWFAPSVAYRMSDTWSVGLSVGFNYVGFGVDLDIRAPNILLAGVDLLQDASCIVNDVIEGVVQLLNLCDGALNPVADLGKVLFSAERYFVPSFNIGGLWSPTDWFQWGWVYQSEVSAKLRGDFELQYSDNWINFFNGLNDSAIGGLVVDIANLPTGVAKEKGQATIELIGPAHFSTGISLQLTQRLKVNADVKWANTSRLDSFYIDVDGGLEILAIFSLLQPDLVTRDSIIFPRGYKDTWSWALGVEYAWSDRLSLRLGYEDRPSAIPDDKADLLAPIGDTALLGAGFEYRTKNDALLEFGLGFIQSKVKIPSDTSRNVNSLAPDNFIYNPYAGWDLEHSLRAILLQFSYHKAF